MTRHVYCLRKARPFGGGRGGGSPEAHPYGLGLVAAIFISLLLPSSALADLGPPILFMTWGPLWISCIEVVVVIIETAVIRHFLRPTVRRAFLAALAANMASAVVGIPIALGLPVAFRIDLRTGVGLVLPLLLASFLIEWPIVKAVSQAGWKRTAAAVAVANLITHTGLVFLEVVGIP